MPRDGGDHRGAACAPCTSNSPDLRCQAARRAARGGNVPARAWLAHLQSQDGDTPQRPAGHQVRDAVGLPPGRR